MIPSFLAEQLEELSLTQLGKTRRAGIKKEYQQFDFGQVKFVIPNSYPKEISNRQFDMQVWNYAERFGLEI